MINSPTQNIYDWRFTINDWRSALHIVNRKPSTGNQPYQLDLVTPGISPVSAKLRKHRRQSWNFL